MLDKIMTEIIGEIEDQDVAVLFSGGIDSLTCAFAAERAGKTVHCYTFFVDGQHSADSKSAIEICEQLNWELTLVDVPVNNIKEDFLKLIRDYDCVKKTQVECTWGFMYLFPMIKERVVISGVTADGLYGNTRKATQHYRHTKELFDSYRKDYFTGNPGGINQLQKLCDEYDKTFIAPYYDERVREWAFKFDHREMRGKKPALDCFSEFKKLKKVRQHASLQLIAGIPTHFEKLLEDNQLNVYNRKTIMHLVNDVAKGNIHSVRNLFSL